MELEEINSQLQIARMERQPSVTLRGEALTWVQDVVDNAAKQEVIFSEGSVWTLRSAWFKSTCPDADRVTDGVFWSFSRPIRRLNKAEERAYAALCTLSNEAVRLEYGN